MKRLQCALAGCLMVALVAAAAPADDQAAAKIDKDKIVGAWKVKKLLPGFPPGETYEFTKDGKVNVSRTISFNVDLNGKEVQLKGVVQLGKPGTYEVDGNKLKIAFKEVGKDKKDLVHTTTITKLTDKELQTKDDKGGISQFEKK